MDWNSAIARFVAAQDGAGLLEQLCQIPAPLGGEGARAAFCLEWLRENGVAQAQLDEVGNVVCRFPGSAAGWTAFLAHLDVVFPDETVLPMEREGNRLYCPGVGDNTANLVNLLLCAKFLALHTPPMQEGLLLCWNVGEEGLGNLRGARALFGRYGGEIRRCYSLDSFDLHRVASTAVGSHRYALETAAPGGHSWFDFGARNAISDLARLIGALDGQPLPTEAKTSYNFGVIGGGTSVNTIAQRASVQYEYRSASQQCLETMQAQLETQLAKLRAEGMDITVTDLGRRPAAASLNPAEMETFLRQTTAIVRQVAGRAADCYESSTDCNIPLSMGIPALTVGTVHAQGMHTRQEWVDLDSLPQGLTLALRLMAQSFAPG